jgi:hypothetical protein
VGVVVACEEQEPVTPVAEQVVAAATPAPIELPQEPPIDESTLRKTYTVNDIKFHECATVQPDGTVVGKNCPPGCLGYGPYANVPRNSNVRIMFELESQTPVVVSSDVISKGALNFHGGLDEQRLPAKEARTYAYTVHVFEMAERLEARLWFRADGPSNFKLKNVAVVVQ